MQISELINTFQLTSFQIVVFRTLPKENLKLYFLFLDRELGSVRCCESPFCAAVNHNNCSHVRSTVLFQKVLQPLAHVLQVPGKQFRPKFFHAFNYWLKVPADQFSMLSDIVEMLHTATLL